MSATESGIAATYDSLDLAEEAVEELDRSGFDIRKVSIVGQGYHVEKHPLGFRTTYDYAISWGTNGAVFGGLWGLVAGAILVLDPALYPFGFEEIVIGRPFLDILMMGLFGAAIAAVAGILLGLAGRIGGAGRHTIRYETRTRASHYQIVVHGTSTESARVRRILHAAAESKRAKEDEKERGLAPAA
jgi:hypothetical protein